MQRLSRLSFPDLNRAHDTLLFWLSAYAVPLVIGLFSVVALAFWPNQFPSATPVAMSMRVLEGSSPTAEPASVLPLLQQQALVATHETALSANPFWLAFTVPPSPANDAGPRTVELPSRRASSLACWDGQSLLPLGHSDRQRNEGALTAAKAGFALQLGASPTDTFVLCQVQSVGSAEISLLLWSSTEYQISAQAFYRTSGLLDGGITVLCLFVLLIALINRNGLYLLFSAWLAVNLRMAELSLGGDTQWLGHRLPAEWLTDVRQLTKVAYYFMTATLFGVLFKDELKRVGSTTVLHLGQWTCVPVFLAALAMPLPDFLRLFWVLSTFNIAVLLYYLARIFLVARSRVVLWCAGGVLITLSAILSEVIASALGVRVLIGSVNSITGALSSSVLTALAVAEHLRLKQQNLAELQADSMQAFNAMPIGLFTLDAQGQLLSANPALWAMLGKSAVPDPVHWGDLFEDGAWTRLHHHLHERRAAPTTRRGSMGPLAWPGTERRNPGTGNPGEIELLGKAQAHGEQPRRFLVQAKLTRGKVQGSLQDVTEKSKATEALYFLANHDSLTKVLSRRGLELALQTEKDELSQGRTLSLAYLDLDRFKLINDMFGHSVGDAVLQQMCMRVTALLPPGVRFGRVGGDEFVLMFAHTPVAMAAHMCKGLIEAIGSQPYRLAASAFYVRGSIGVVEVDEHMPIKDALSAAERACQQAKEAQRDGLVVYQKHSAAYLQHEAELTLIAQLSGNTPFAGFYLEMQPLLSLNAPEASLDFEVLLRMNGPTGTPVPTTRLLAAAQASGCMGKVDLWVLSTTLAWLRAHQHTLVQTRFACVNLSGASLNDERFLEAAYALLDAHHPLLGMLCLEITESVALQDIKNTRKFIDKVRRMGASVALDDFGAGYTSFSYLKDIRADLLKIDGSFVVDMNAHPTHIAIVQAIVRLAKSLGMQVIAEWVEDHATLQALKHMGVDYAQGRIISDALAPARILGARSGQDFLVQPQQGQTTTQVIA